MSRIKQGRIVRRENKTRKGNEKRFYNTMWAEDENGDNERPLMFTDAEIARADKSKS